MASLGRESIVRAEPLMRRWMSAKYVLSFRSVISTHSTVTPSSVSTLRSRSCVIGRAILMPSSSVAMAVASSKPIQMGRLSLLSRSLRITIGVLVTGSSVSPPTLIKIEFSRLIRAAPALASRYCVQKRSATSIPFWPRSAHQTIDDAVQLIQIAALLDHIAVRQIAIHFAVAEAPRQAILRVQPDHLLGALVNLLEHPLVRQIVVVARIAQDDHAGLIVHR